jgi:circadian clock protein KaiC
VHDPAIVSSAGQHVDGVIVLELESVGARDLRTIRVVKLRGAQHRLGRHSVEITDAGMEVFPRLESLVGGQLLVPPVTERASLGISGLDAMLGGGVLRSSSTMMLGTPGSGKTLCGIHFIAEGAARGEHGMIATFHEPAALLSRTAAKLGRDLIGPIDSGLVRVLWRPPLELLADAWAWQLLDDIDRHRPERLFIDGLSDIQRMVPNPDRMSVFVPALTNELRSRGVTTLMTVEIDAYVGSELVAPVPAASATMDTGILLRHVEVGSRIHRLVSVLKARESQTDSAIREFVVGSSGIEVGEIFTGAAGLLTGAPTLTNRVPPVAFGEAGR